MRRGFALVHAVVPLVELTVALLRQSSCDNPNETFRISGISALRHRGSRRE